MQSNFSMTRDELATFLASEVIDTSEATEILGCTRQNLHKIIGKKITPILKTSKTNLYLRTEILELKKSLSK